MLFVSPRHEQALAFANTRLFPAIEGSPCIRRALFGSSRRRPSILSPKFANGSQLFIRPAFHTADGVRGLSGDLLFVDEFQDVAAGYLPVLQETLSHSERGYTIITATPKMIDNPIEDVFRLSTGCEWQVPCGGWDITECCG